MKKGVLVFAVVLLIGFVSAQDLSLSRALDSIDKSTMILGALFLIFFAILNFALGKFFKDKRGDTQRAVVAVISFALSLLIIYWINSSIDVENLFYDLGLSGEFLETIVPLIILAGVIYLLFKIKCWVFLILTALLLFIAIFTEWIYEEDLVLVIIIILVVMWILCLIFRKIFGKKEPKDGYRDGYRDFDDRIDRKERERERRRIDDERRRADDEMRRRKEAEEEKQEAEEKYKREEAKSIRKFNLARRIGIRRLQENLSRLIQEYNDGVRRAKKYHKEATKLGWTKAGIKPKKGKDPREAADKYRAWYRQYSRNIQLEKSIKEHQKRIEHLRRQLK